MSKAKKKMLVPNLRFPEFRDAGEWEKKTLGEISARLTEKVGDRKLTTVSITAGTGFVSQAEKFSRDISGKQYKNYIILKKGEFAYNKGNSKRFPQGSVYQLKEFDEVAAPNAFISFTFKKDYVGEFYQGYFDSNFHGRQLIKFITSGARSDGLLNISPDDFFSIVLPTPVEKEEQQKIADCLSSIDALITAHSQKLESLKAHKKGLMQQLFPREGETVPRLRFPEFRDAGEWSEVRLSRLIQLISGLHLSPNEYGESGPTPYFTGPSDFTNKKTEISKWTRKTTNTAIEGDILITVKGSGVGELWFLTLPTVAMGRQLMAIRATNCINTFLYQFLSTKKQLFESLGMGNLIPGLSRSDIQNLKLWVPSQSEQQKIADCLSSLDALITAQSEKVETLKAHKKGLMQQLFPQEVG